MKTKEFYENRDIPFFKPSDMADEVSFLSNVECFIDKRAEPVCRMFEKDAVLVSCIGSIGKVGVAKSSGTCNQQINFIEHNSNTNPIYIAHAISLRKQILIDIAHAPVVPIINKTEFSKFPIPRPPLALQNEFAAFIEELDKSKVVCERERFLLEKCTGNCILAEGVVKDEQIRDDTEII